MKAIYIMHDVQAIICSVLGSVSQRFIFPIQARPCVCRIACCSLVGVISECPDGCMVMLDVPDDIVRNLLEYPLSSANGAFTLII